jgi:hypothetical protein
MRIIIVCNAIISVALGAILAYNYVQDNQTVGYIDQCVTIQASIDLRNSAKIDSLNRKVDELARVALYLDSCQQVRTSKTDRAERRGKFVGGVLKSLFPRL